MPRQPKSFISVIIPVKKINSYILESVPKILNLNYPSLEIIIFVDKLEKKYSWSKTRIIESGQVGPAEKRDLAIKYAKGDILAFLDDDAYPQYGWLKQASVHFTDERTAAVGGPAVTPVSDSVPQKAFGAVSESFLGGGKARNRFLPIGKTKEIDDWPSVNLLIRKNIFKKLGGFDSVYWPGEDTKLCLEVLKAGYKIIYEPTAIAYHHRRTSLIKYLCQIGNYGLHRGYFAKKHPETSLRLWYFTPSLFIIYLFSLIFISRNTSFHFLFIPLIIYLFCLIIDGLIISFRWKSLVIGLLTIPLIFVTHLWYGFRFIWGLLLPNLKK